MSAYQSDVYYQSDIYAPEYHPAPVDLPDPSLSGKALETFITKKVFPAFDLERGRLAHLECWGAGKQPSVRPLKRNTERAVLQRMARTPWIPVMISTFAQQMIVDGYRKEGETENSEGWKSWVRNKMTAQQISLNRAVMTYGYAYVRVTEGSDENEDVMAIMRAVDPMDCFALYDDPYADEYPQFVLEKLPQKGKYRWWLSNGDYYPLTFDKGKFTAGELESTKYGKAPFVRYVNQIDLRGRCWGDVESVIDLAARIDKTVFDRLLVQHFNSFKVRWATGLEQPDTSAEVEETKIRVGHEDILISSEAQARFGTLDETSMDGFIAAYKADLETFAAVMQLPPNLLGQVVNVAADALDGARKQTYQRLFEKQTVMGESHAQVLRLAALIEGREDDASDFFARVHWQDVEVRSLAQFADAWGKICSQLGVPKIAAWHRIPGVEQTEVEAWEKKALDDDPLTTYLREVVGVTTTSVGVDSKTGEPKPPPVAPNPGGSGGGGPNNPTNQRPLNNKTGVSRGTAVK